MHVCAWVCLNGFVILDPLDPLDLVYFWLRGLGSILSQNPLFLYYLLLSRAAAPHRCLGRTDDSTVSVRTLVSCYGTFDGRTVQSGHCCLKFIFENPTY
eukprot:COSAG02_NODE_1412_length_12756_cov_57.891048_11_plen_99_part_00